MMGKANDKKTAALGMPIGTASGRLRKNITFMLIVRLKENFCYQCGSEIVSANDMSIEHMEPWLQADNPVESFFDLKNIAFSHLSCNVAAATPRQKMVFHSTEYLAKQRTQHPSRSKTYRRKEYKQAKENGAPWTQKNT